MTPRKIMQGHLNIVSHYTGLSTHACMQAHRLSPSHNVSKLATAPLIITLFPIPPHALLDDIEHMHYTCALVIWLLSHPRPLSFLLLWKLKDN